MVEIYDFIYGFLLHIYDFLVIGFFICYDVEVKSLLVLGYGTKKNHSRLFYNIND